MFNYTRLGLIPLGAVYGLGLLGYAGAGSQAPQASATGAPDWRAPCEDALFESGTAPPIRLKAPDAKLITPPDFHGPALALQVAAHRGMGSNACATIRFSVASDGTVHDVKMLADYPQGVGFGDALAASFALAKYPPAAAGGPYGIDIQVRAHRNLAKTS